MIIEAKEGFVKIMSKDIIPAVANTAVATTATTGFWAWISQNASEITVAATVLSLIVAIVFNVINTKIRKQSAELDNEKKRLEIKQMELEIKKQELNK